MCGSLPSGVDLGNLKIIPVLTAGGIYENMATFCKHCTQIWVYVDTDYVWYGNKYPQPPCTVCYQVWCQYWGQFSLFPGGMFLLNTYNGLHGRFIINIYSDKIYKYIFLVYAIWVTQAFSLKICYSLNIEPYCLYVCVYHGWPQTLAKICRSISIYLIATCLVNTKQCMFKYSFVINS